MLIIPRKEGKLEEIMQERLGNYLRFTLILNVLILNLVSLSFETSMDFDCNSVLVIYKLGEDVPSTLQQMVSRL